MTAPPRARRVLRGAEFALAFAAGVAAFALIAVALAVVEADVFAAILGAACVAAVIAIARRWGVAYAVPPAMAALLAYDWYQFPPTHAEELPSSGNLANLLVYLTVSVLVGELAATATRRAEASEREAARLADEQAALRRVATVVAREAPPAEVFAAVADGTVTIVADRTGPGSRPPVLTGLPVGGQNVASEVHRTGRPARVDDYATATGAVAAAARDVGVRSAVGSPIAVDGRLWGVVIVATRRANALPAGTESRIEEFTELIATAISNIETRSELAESRARLLAAADQERRRVVRDLHDGAQQRLVHTVITLKLARHALERGDDAALDHVTAALDNAQHTTAELRELAHGILPAALTRGGLHAGVEALASRMPVPVESDVSVERLPAAVEATAYFVVAEALTNVAKHAQAGHVDVEAHVEDGVLRLHVRDDGVGGARPDGSGLVGLRDRLAVLDGRLRVESPAAGGTLVDAAIPLGELEPVDDPSSARASSA